MRDLYLKRNELCTTSLYLRSAKFQSDLPADKVEQLIDRQQEVYNKFKFYDNYIKIGGKIKMNEKRYVLKKGDYYLSDIMVEDNKLINFTIDNDYRRLYDNYELAEDDRKLIFIETGLNLEVKIFKEKED